MKQLSKCIDVAREAFGTRSVVIAGDLNTELLPGSCVAALLSDLGEPTEVELRRECASALRLVAESADDVATAGSGDAGSAASHDDGSSVGDGGDVVAPTADQMHAWRQLHASASRVARESRVQLERVPTGATRAAYAHGASSGPCQSWRLDHILFSRRGLTLAQHSATLEAMPEVAALGLPCKGHASDHLPIACALSVSPIPSLAVEDRHALLERLDALLVDQATARQQLEQEAAAQVAAAAATEEGGTTGATAGASSSDPPPAIAAQKASKRPKKGPPSAAMQALLREKRERDKALKAQQREQRVSFLAECSELELDALEELDAMDRLRPLIEGR